MCAKCIEFLVTALQKNVMSGLKHYTIQSVIIDRNGTAIVFGKPRKYVQLSPFLFALMQTVALTSMIYFVNVVLPTLHFRLININYQWDEHFEKFLFALNYY